MMPAESTSFVHDGVTMTEYKNEPFIVGDYKHTEVEFFHSTHKKWYTATPFQQNIFKYIFGYAPISRPDKVFILGGCCDQKNDWSAVSVFANDNWQSHGSLNHGRLNFMTITYGTHVMIIGGILRNDTL